MKKVHLLLLATATAALAQGPLAPPGAPAPTMKTLDQVEARTPIETLPYTISTSGSYYFTKNLQFTAASGNAITITTNNVTLDLNGFTLSSTSGVTGIAISVNDDLNNIAIKNGKIAGNTTVTITGTAPDQTWATSKAGFDYGIYANAPSSRNMTVDQIQVSGCRNDGIYAYYGSVATCAAQSNNTSGENAFDLYAIDAVIAFTKFGTGTTTGITLTGNKTP